MLARLKPFWWDFFIHLKSEQWLTPLDWVDTGLSELELETCQWMRPIVMWNESQSVIPHCSLIQWMSWSVNCYHSVIRIVFANLIRPFGLCLHGLWLCFALARGPGLAVKLKMINQDHMIFGDLSVNFERISLIFCRGHFLLKS